MEQELTTTDKVKLYKSRVSSRYLSVEFEGIAEGISKHDQYYVSTKLDGHFYALYYKKGEGVYFLNPKGRKVEVQGLVKAATEVLEKKADLEQCIIPGELYLKGEERTRAFTLTKARTDEDENLSFAAFDLIEINGSPYYTNTVEERVNDLREIFPEEGTVHLVDFQVVESRDDIAQLFKEAVEIKDQEGLVVKTEQYTYKVKPKHTFEGVIIGFADSDGDRVGMFRDLLLAMLLPDESFQIVGHLHHGFDDQARKELTEEMFQETVPSQYIEVARNKTAFHFIKPSRVIEFSCLDVITEDSKGPIGKMNLTFSKESGYKIKSMNNSVSFTIANFIRFRDDKNVTFEDVGFKQLNEVISFDEVDTINTESLPDASIVHREVYTKESKGNLMVRKFLVVKTNKESSNKYPAYVLQFTDFSAGRKDPIKRDVKLTNDKGQVMELLAASIEKNIKSGWNKQ